MGLFLSLDASAKTNGSYLSADLIRSQVRFYEKFSQGTNTTTRIDKPSFKNARGGFGFTYKYAFNYGNFFVTPGAFYEKNNLVITGDPEKTRSLEVKDRFGAKVDVGYDLTDNFAIYAIGGYSGVNYKSRNYSYQGGGELTSRTKSDIVGSAFYGAGLKVDLNKDFSVSAEYTSQKFSARTRIPNDYNNHKGSYKTRLDVAKISFAYRF